MRGKGPRYGGYYYETRITPAHAGKRIALLIYYHNVGDHPRPCGEKREVLVYLSEGQGSPPPMRGKERVFFDHL